MNDDPRDDDDEAEDVEAIDDAKDEAAIDPRVRKILEAVYEVEGVVGAKVWVLPAHVAVALRVGNRYGASDVIAHVVTATSSLRDPDEAWDFGLLDGDP
jgi:hypothetical protein